jgi:AraC family transcriptional regulator
MQFPEGPSARIWDVTRATEVLGGLQPLASNISSKRADFTVERYLTGEMKALRARFDRHVIGIQWTGDVKEVGGAYRSISAPNAISIFPAGLTLQEGVGRDVDFTHLTLYPAFLHRVACEMNVPDQFELIPQWGIHDQQIESLARGAEVEIQSGLKAGALFMESIATALGAHLLTRYSSRRVAAREPRRGLSPYALRRSKDFIEANLGQDFGLAELAANVEMSPYHFCRLFKQSTNLSPHQYVLRRRIDRAQWRLKEHRLSMVDIATELGFSDQSHFARIFRRLVGTTPKQYASQN